MQREDRACHSVQPAGLIRRLSALAYDLLLVGGILLAGSFILIGLRGGQAVPAGNLLYQIFLAVLVAAFFVFFWCRGGQTLGMRTWGIRLETEEGTGVRPRTACLRFVSALLSLSALGLGFLWILFDRDGRAWHDRISGTRVVKLAPTNGRR